MLLIGVITTLLGLAGLIYCMVQAYRAKRTGLQGEALTNHLRRLVAVNLAAFFLSAIGLVIVLVAILL